MIAAAYAWRRQHLEIQHTSLVMAVLWEVCALAFEGWDLFCCVEALDCLRCLPISLYAMTMTYFDKCATGFGD